MRLESQTEAGREEAVSVNSTFRPAKPSELQSAHLVTPENPLEYHE
jgi:hypothetical protein